MPEEETKPEVKVIKVEGSETIIDGGTIIETENPEILIVRR